MKTYRVLDGHNGDKEYKAGDTRVADPEAVKHLVKLGVLEEVEGGGDSDAIDTVKPGSTSRIEALTQERDAAHRDAVDRAKEVAALTHERDAARRETKDRAIQIETLTGERDVARTDLEKAREDLHATTIERDTLRDARSEHGGGEDGEQPPASSPAAPRRGRGQAN